MANKPKPMKSPKPPKWEKIPSGIPQWQKDILRDQYNSKYQEYIDKMAKWRRQNTPKPKTPKPPKQGVGNPDTPGFKMGRGTE